RTHGVRAYLSWRWDGLLPEDPGTEAHNPSEQCPFWDWDAAVLARNLEQLGTAGHRQAVAVMPFLLVHADERVRDWAVATLAEVGKNEHLAEALALLDEPRNGAGDAVRELLSKL